jgi:probable rRNA maturation factor
MREPTVFIRCQNAGKRVDPRTIRRRTVRLLKALHLEDAEVSVLLCDDSFIHELNNIYRGIDKPTDVLSFSMAEGERPVGSSNILGDVVISVDTAERQAPGLEHSTTDEVTSLLIHGLLHLLGYDHLTLDDEKEMTSKANYLASLILR